MSLFKKIFGLLAGVFVFLLDCVVDDDEPQGVERRLDPRFDYELDNHHHYYHPSNPIGHNSPYFSDPDYFDN